MKSLKDMASKVARIPKKYWYLFFVIPLILLFFLIDFGFNAKYFVKKDFSEAFITRKSGNCELFKEFVVEVYQGGWSEDCYMEKNGGIPGIVSFKILSVQVSGDDAFLQVELDRGAYKNEDLKPYSVNYQMLRVRSGVQSTWVINQEKK